MEIKEPRHIGLFILSNLHITTMTRINKFKKRGEKIMNQLIEKVKQWSIEKGLNHAEPSKQFLKVVEETGEIAAALARNDMEELQDAIGDTIVTLIILAQ